MTEEILPLETQYVKIWVCVASNHSPYCYKIVVDKT